MEAGSLVVSRANKGKPVSVIVASRLIEENSAGMGRPPSNDCTGPYENAPSAGTAAEPVANHLEVLTPEHGSWSGAGAGVISNPPERCFSSSSGLCQMPSFLARKLFRTSEAAETKPSLGIFRQLARKSPTRKGGPQDEDGCALIDAAWLLGSGTRRRRKSSGLLLGNFVRRGRTIRGYQSSSVH